MFDTPEIKSSIEKVSKENNIKNKHIPYCIQVIGTPIGQMQDSWRISGIKAVDNSKLPFTGQPDGTCDVFLLKKLRDKISSIIDKYGDNVGYTIHHCGMGMDSEELCLLKINPEYESK